MPVCSFGREAHLFRTVVGGQERRAARRGGDPESRFFSAEPYRRIYSCSIPAFWSTGWKSDDELFSVSFGSKRRPGPSSTRSAHSVRAAGRRAFGHEWPLLSRRTTTMKSRRSFNSGPASARAPRSYSASYSSVAVVNPIPHTPFTAHSLEAHKQTTLIPLPRL